MPIPDHVFQEMDERRRRRVAALTGRNQPAAVVPDTTRLALEGHAAAVERSHLKTAANYPAARAPVVSGPARSWVNDFQVEVGDFSLPASLVLVSILRHPQGLALLNEIRQT